MHIKLKSLLKIIAVSLVVIGVSAQGTNAAFAATKTTDKPCQGDYKTCACPTIDPIPGCGTDPTADPGKAILDCTGDNIADKGCTLFTKYLNPFIKLLSALAGISVVIGIIVGGIQYSMSGGDPQKTAKAKRVIRNSIVALLVFLFLGTLLKFLIPGTGLLIG